MAGGGSARGARLSTLLVVLALVPLLGVLAATTALVGAQVRTERTSRSALSAVVVTGQVGATRSALAREAFLSSARTHLSDAGVRERLGPGVVGALRAALPEDDLAVARRRTDAALAAVAPASAAGDLAVGVARDLAPLRTAVDAAVPWSAVAPGFTALTAQLAGAERLAVDEAAAGGVGAEVAGALLEVRTVTEAVAADSGESLDVLEELVLAQGPVTGRAAADWASAAPLDVLGSSPAPGVRVRSEELLATTTGLRASAAAVTARVGVAPGDARLAAQVRDLLTRLTGRSAGLDALAATTSARAGELARGETASARRDVVVLAAGGVLLCLLTGAAVLGTSVALGRPLRELAAAAQQVGRGELASVVVSGPREVRVVAEGLAATVASLRRLQEQARAVVAGDLRSPVLATPLPGPLGTVVHASVTELVQAMVDRDRLREDLTHRATHDSLTELPNRARAMELLDRALERSRRDGGVVGLLFVDLDRFKQVNDTAGHAAGDAVLRAVAARMRERAPAGGTVCRLGGDEFLVVVEDADDAGLLGLAEALVDDASAPVAFAGTEVAVGASVGVARTAGGTAGREELLAEADAAAYQAKQEGRGAVGGPAAPGGRGGVGFYDDDLRLRLTGARDLEEALARALRERELVLRYQAVVGLDPDRDTEGVTGYEALVRWQRPGHGLLPPSEFVPAAERSSLVCDLGRYVLLEATRQLARWSAGGGAAAGRTVSVNVSGRHLVSHHLLQDVRDALEGSGLEPHRLVVEITETVLVDHALAHERLAALRALGVRVAIDDFGTGFTSIAQLHRLPADVLKVDRSLAAADDPASAELVRLVVGAARTFSLAVVAEGVETPAQLDALRAASCDAVQGYLLHRPCAPGAEAPEIEAGGAAVREPVAEGSAAPGVGAPGRGVEPPRTPRPRTAPPGSAPPAPPTGPPTPARVDVTR
ncbi:EAL domain-containing protein [uncultured Pseudokineococcus sp.]|uniref:putative bifunctional diguanylate cyclase/phosphodiesterase n=1 Tax=uncultured Pseudokineococcus sp. TaxID=1642928 RepID=UPI00263183AF|nr:EAL domain-containing protein [uncultured Pseudokineococcus sp.]